MMGFRSFFFVLAFAFLISCSYPLQVTHAFPEQTSPDVSSSPAIKEGKVPGRPPDDIEKIESRKRVTISAPSDRGASQSSPEGKPASDSNARPAVRERMEKGENLQEANGQETLDVALDLLSQSRTFWEKGDVDNALKSLDEAYALILEVNGDPDFSRQKDDMRLMISKLILQICASRHTVTTGKQSEIPMILNADVEKEIRSFQTVERGFFLRSYQRSGAFLPAILKDLKEAGLPKELAWLPLVESGFQVGVLSRARALGLWQFIPSTGYKYALKRDRWIDERMDLEKSTRAAIAYLKELHNIFGDWLTVLAAYNCGEGKVLRVISKQHINYLDHFWDLYRQLPMETARYVPRFLATLHIIRDPRKYGMDLSENPDKPTPYETVISVKCMRLQDIASHLDVSQDVMHTLNSELRLRMTPDSEYPLRVPDGTGRKFTKVEDQIPKWEPPRPSRSRFIRHRVRSGETMASIAKKYHVTKQDILAVNKISSKKPLRSGQRIRIPVEDYPKTAGKSVRKKEKRETAASDAAGKVIRYRVKKGDTLQSIAGRHNTTVEDLRQDNGIKGSKVLIGQVLKIKSKTIVQKDPST